MYKSHEITRLTGLSCSPYLLEDPAYLAPLVMPGRAVKGKSSTWSEIP
jgi:hypothetical protein